MPPAALANRSQFTMFQATREVRSADPGVRAAALDEVEALGVQWLRVNLYWQDVAPDPRRAVRARRSTRPTRPPTRRRAWVIYDRMFADAACSWTAPAGDRHRPGPALGDAVARGPRHTAERDALRALRGAVGRRYGAQVSYWSVWNEPNHPGFLAPQYVRGPPVLAEALPAAVPLGAERADRSGNERDRVLMGETAPRGNSNVVFPLAFVRGALCLDSSYRKRRGCGSLRVDGWAHHPYTTSKGPWFVSRRPDDVTIGSLSRLTRALDRARRAKAVRKRVDLYLTEFGVQSRPDRIVGVSEERQAEYRSISEQIAYRNPRVRAFSQYLLRDDLPREGSLSQRYGGFESGLRHSGGEAKIAYDGFRLPLVAERGSRSTRLWGLVRPAGGRTTVRVEYRNRGSSRWRTLKRDRTDSRGYWATTTSSRSGRSYRVRWDEFVGAPTRSYRR